MDSRNLIGNIKKVEILLDTASFNSLLAQNNRVASAILSHHDPQGLMTSPFEFLRTSIPTSFALIERIPDCRYKYTADGWINNITVSNRTILFDHRKDYVISTAQKTFGHQEITKREMDKIFHLGKRSGFNSKNPCRRPFRTFQRLWFNQYRYHYGQ